MLENIEIDKKKKAKLKIITALKDTTIKQIVLQEITNILENNTPITEHTTTRNRESLIIDVDATLKAKIKQHKNQRHMDTSIRPNNQTKRNRRAHKWWKNYLKHSTN